MGLLCPLFPLNLRMRSAKLLVVESHFCIVYCCKDSATFEFKISTPRGTVTHVSTNEGAYWSPSLVGETKPFVHDR